MLTVIMMGSTAIISSVLTAGAVLVFLMVFSIAQLKEMTDNEREQNSNLPALRLQ